MCGVRQDAAILQLATFRYHCSFANSLSWAGHQRLIGKSAHSKTAQFCLVLHRAEVGSRADGKEAFPGELRNLQRFGFNNVAQTDASGSTRDSTSRCSIAALGHPH